LQNLRKAFLSLRGELCLVHDERAILKALRKVKEQQSDATIDDAKGYYIMTLLDKRFSSIHEKEKITGPQKKKRDKYVKYILQDVC